MISGDLDTMPLSDLLQWADATRAAGRLTVERGDARTVIGLSDRSVVEVSPPPEVMGALRRLAPDADRPWLRIPESVEAAERLLDLFLEGGGRFVFAPGEARGTGIPVDLPMREVIFEGMRQLDELPTLARTYPDEGARLGGTFVETPAGVSPLGRVLLRCAAMRLTLGEVRLSLGLSRPALLRRVHELVRGGHLTVEGAEGRGDPVGRLLDQAQALVRAAQFDEAAHVLGALLQADPSDRRVRELLEAVQRQHLAALYDELGRRGVPHLVSEDARTSPRLRTDERAVAELVDGERDLGAVVAAAPTNELETLKALAKLVHLGLARV